MHAIFTGSRTVSGSGLRRAALLFILGAACACAAVPPPPDFKVAFIGDQGLGAGAVATLELIKQEGADLVVHLGDFDYTDSPAAWERQTDSILGPGFPQIAVIGNHDLLAWNGPGGYSEFIRSRLHRMGVSVQGEPGVQCSFRYQGIFFVLTAPGLMRGGHGEFIRRELAADSSLWKISAWHMNQSLMQVGSKPDETGWEVYEESRRGGAIIATAHEHTYSRTHLLGRMSSPEVVSRDSVLRVRKGRTFAFVSGLGGDEIRPQLRGGDWWAKSYTATQGAESGALFATFHVDGDPRKAAFYFKAVNGAVIDSFGVYSESERAIRPGIAFPPALPRTLELNPEALGIVPGSRLRLDDLNGRSAARLENVRAPVSLQLDRTGLLFMRTSVPGKIQVRTFVFLP